MARHGRSISSGGGQCAPMSAIQRLSLTPHPTAREQDNRITLWLLILQRGFEMWCNAASQPCVEGGQHERRDRDDPTDGFGAPRYGAPGGGVAQLSRHRPSPVAAA